MPAHGSGMLSLLAFAAVVCAPLALTAQMAPPAGARSAPAAPAAASGARAGQEPVFNTPPIAIVPIDKSIRGAALEVAGPLQTWDGRAYLTSNGSVTAGDQTAQVTLPYRGTLRVCGSSTVKLAGSPGAEAGQAPGLLMALDHGAVEMSFAPSEARTRNADTLLTPFFRILIGGASAADVKVRLGENGDTCVDNSIGSLSGKSSSSGSNSGADAPYVVVSSVFEGGVYRVQPGQRVMFEHGSLHEVVDQEKEQCGCPPAPKSEANEFPLAQSEGLTQPRAPLPAVQQPAENAQASTAMVYNSAENAPKTVAIPQPPAAPPAPAAANPPAQTTNTQKEPGFFRRVGRFFKRVFGAE